MKIILGIIFLLPACGVFGAETNEPVSVMEGQTVTLNTDIIGIKEITRIMWRFETLPIAEFNNNKTTYLNDPERFNRLKLNSQTGSLTIMNIKTTDTGLYKAEINHNTGTSKWLFNVTLSDSGLSPGAAAGISVIVLLLVFAGAAAFVFYHRHKFLPKMEGQKKEFVVQQCQMYDAKIVSVKEGESVTLKPDAVIERDDQILWKFGPQETLIAEVNGNTREISTGDCADGRFRDRLMLDSKTGSVTITNTASEHVGVYKLKIISSTGTSYQTFILTLIQDVMSVSEGSSVTLNNDTEIQNNDLILWMFGDEDSLIAQLEKTTGTVAFPDVRFKSLNLDKKTGSLTITNFKNNHTGLYKLQISNSSRATTSKNFKVLLNFNKVSVMEGKPVTLKVNGEIGKTDQIQWLCGEENTLIAEIKEGGSETVTYDTTDGRFKGNLMLDDKTGSLTIKNTRPEHTGLYTLKINSSKGASDKQFFIIVKGMTLGKEGNNITLNVHAELQRDGLILWMFGDENSLIAQMNGETTETTFTEADERFRDKLQLDKMTGSLTIRDITNEHFGAYKLHILSSKKPTYSTFRVFVFGESVSNTVSVITGESLILITNFNVERGDQLQWTFEGEILASGRNGDVSETSYGGDKRFRCRLELHHQTASLTVKNTRSSDTGVYQLNFWNRQKKNICLKVNVTVSDDSRNTPSESVNIQMPHEEILSYL
ncbi:uncharacterized protein LOC130215494 isoform X2 [Danio aesculapii]|uniref:uncharacterized protein LOC130215494 isoform X2 n=1 Tax=Danio aesculapii TaxID=1142201 RepID=UPI0024C023C0|nr:uncharacterized protein LOC130215494 isoform X2 [Danio aesculapii]